VSNKRCAAQTLRCDLFEDSPERRKIEPKPRAALTTKGPHRNSEPKIFMRGETVR
jgi:hypothetical protein